MEVVLDTRCEEFVIDSVKQGRYSSENDVVREALLFLAEEERKEANLRELLREGEMSGWIEDFDPQAFLEEMHKKYL